MRRYLKSLMESIEYLVLLLIVLLLMLFCGCRSSKVTQSSSIHDTVYATIHDTVRSEKIREIIKKEYVSDSIYIIADSSGKPIYKEKVRLVFVDSQQKDSTGFYKSLADSLKRTNNSTQQEQKVVVKNKHHFVIPFLTALAIFAILFVWLRKRKNK